MRNFRICWLAMFLSLTASALWAQGNGSRLRVLVLTDIENEPDDAQSMVRFLTYANHWDVEGLIATTSVHQKKKIAAWRIREIVSAYGKVRDNLLLHEKGYPDSNYFKSIIKEGYADFGMNAVGQGKDSEGSEWIINTIDKKMIVLFGYWFGEGLIVWPRHSGN